MAYGDWDEYDERLDEEIAKGEGVIGVRCTEPPGHPVCDECVRERLDWQRRNGLVKGEEMSLEVAGRLMAGLGR